MFRDGITDPVAHFSLPLLWESTALMKINQKTNAAEDSSFLYMSGSATAAESSTKARPNRSKGLMMAASAWGREIHRITKLHKE